MAQQPEEHTDLSTKHLDLIPVCAMSIAKHQNHRTTEWFGLEGMFEDHLVQHHCHGQGHLSLDQVAQSPVKPDRDHFQGWGIHSFSGQTVQVPHHPHSKCRDPNHTTGTQAQILTPHFSSVLMHGGSGSCSVRKRVQHLTHLRCPAGSSCPRLVLAKAMCCSRRSYSVSRSSTLEESKCPQQLKPWCEPQEMMPKHVVQAGTSHPQ